MSRTDRWECDAPECTKVVTGAFPKSWLSQRTVIGSGYIGTGTDTQHYCCAKCANDDVLSEWISATALLTACEAPA